MAVDLRAHLTKQLTTTLHLIKRDIEAMTPEQLAHAGGTETRTPYDFIYECAVVNKRMTDRIRKVEPTPWPWNQGEYAVAPDDWRDKAVALERLETSVKDLLEAALVNPDEEIQLPDEVETAFGLALFADFHTGYHLGQINYVQTLYGDRKMHWF
ncbi:MAG: hypothetical protein SFX74_00155 [Fimbriimonadaceae bacterium]|nr:hypothetical protein [Fimbriimonadaceae bacterium]